MYGHTLCFLKPFYDEFSFHNVFSKTMLISKKSPLWEIQEFDDIYLIGIFVATTSVGPLVNLMFFLICQLSNGQL